MSDDDMRLDAIPGLDLRTLVPEAFAGYRPAIAEALGFFLRHLPHLAEVVAEQLRMPREWSPARRLTSLVRACPTLHKLGQVVARDRRLPKALRGRLETLESMEATTPLSKIEAVVEREFGPPGQSGIRLGPRALAEGSVAVVVPFHVFSEGTSTHREGVLKVLKPGIAERLSGELAIWSDLGAFLDERCGDYDLPRIPYQETFETLRDLLVREVRLDIEQRHLQSAAKFYACSDSVWIPELLPYCTNRITAMERVVGKKVTDIDDLAPYDRRCLAGRVLDALVLEPLWSSHASSVFHADPHAGNLLLSTDGRLAILDWALVGRLSREERASMVQVALGALTLNESHITRAIDALAVDVPDASRLREEVEAAVKRLEVTNPPGFRWVIELLDSVSVRAGVRFGGDMLLFRKSFLTADGVVADVWHEDVVDRVLARSAFHGVWSEWGSRIWASPTSRDFGTHVSNLDLLRAYFSLPYAASRLWFNQWRNAALVTWRARSSASGRGA